MCIVVHMLVLKDIIVQFYQFGLQKAEIKLIN